MLTQIIHWLSSHGTLVAASTIAFFTVKGLAWLVLPALLWRHSAKKKLTRKTLI